MSPEIVKLVDALAKISAPVWDAYIFQQRVFGFLIMLFGIILEVFFLICLSQHSKAPESERSDDLSAKDGWLIGCIISFVVGLLCLGNGFIHVINPVYYAAQTLLGR